MRETTVTVTIGWHSALKAIQRIVAAREVDRFCRMDAEALEAAARSIREMLDGNKPV